jgi:ferredoxin-NADP reductase
MHLNHRGGLPGFAVVASSGQSISWPDYSGNRKYTSLGNIVSDAVAGLLFVDWSSGDTLHLTGTASLLTASAAAEAMQMQMHVSAATRLDITGFTFLRAAVSLRGRTVEASPYSPPLRSLGPSIAATSASASVLARLVAVESLCESVATFSFELTSPVSILPGQHVILDFSSFIAKANNADRYHHMFADKPQVLNDDGIRSYTVSATSSSSSSSFSTTSSSGWSSPCDQVSITVKRKSGGTISSLLHSWKRGVAEMMVPLLAVSGDFTCEGREGEGVGEGEEGRDMLWIAAGSGVTPFLAMLRGLVVSTTMPRPRVTLLLSTACEEVALVDPFLRDASGAMVEVQHFITRGGGGAEGRRTGAGTARLSSFTRRLAERDVTGLPLITSPQSSVWICGPNAFAEEVQTWLNKTAVPSNRIHVESFAF